MADYEIYKAVANKAVAADLAATASPFTIEVRFVGGLTTKQKNAFKLAADRWTTIIVGDLPSVMVDGEVIDDVLIMAQGSAIDGPGQILGQAGPTHIRPANAGAAAFLPAKGVMTFDTADLKVMETKKTLNDVITHEMGHVLGIGSIWKLKKLLKGEGTANPTFSGKAASKAYGGLTGGGSKAVPVENQGGPGTRDAHWRETVFHNELMTGFVATPGNPLSAITVGSLKDLGYTVDMSKAEPYAMPNLLQLAEAGVMAARAPSGVDGGLMLPLVPLLLPDSSLR